MELGAEATITNNGQVTIPPAIRSAMGLQPGTRLYFSMKEPGEVLLKPLKKDITAIFGMFKSDRHVSIDEMSAESGFDDFD